MALFRRGRRRQIVVDKRFQYRATFIGIVYIVAVAGFVTLPLVNMMRSTNLLLQGHSQELVNLYRGQQASTLIALIVFFVGLVVAWSLFSLYRTHKVAGPVVKLTRYIHYFSAGDFSGRIQLRSGDELQALANGLNSMAESLQERDESRREHILTRIRDAKQELHRNPSVESSDQVIEELCADVDRCFTEDPSPSAPKAETPQEELVFSEN